MSARGQVRCAHGILPVPAPATALLLSGVPIYGGAVQGELCTPTGAALLTHFVTKFGELPAMRLLKSGYGMGTKDFPQPTACARRWCQNTSAPTEEILELSCNLDDCTGEAIGFAMERLLDAGALDVYWTSVGMKKNRPGILLTCMCRPLDREKMVELLFRHTTTLGVRESAFRRYTLSRESKTIQTPDGDIRVKVSTGYGVAREKPEFEDLAKIAREDRKEPFRTSKKHLNHQKRRGSQTECEPRRFYPKYKTRAILLRTARAILCLRVILIIDGFQVLLDEVCVDLCGGNVAVAEHLLNGTKVCAVL